MTKPDTPTRHMVSAAEKIAAALDLRLPPRVFQDYDQCRKWLDTMMQRPAPPTERMLAIAEQLEQTHGVTMDEVERSSLMACRDFIITFADKPPLEPETEELV